MSRMSPASEEVGVFGCLFVCLFVLLKGQRGGLRVRSTAGGGCSRSFCVLYLVSRN